MAVCRRWLWRAHSWDTWWVWRLGVAHKSVGKLRWVAPPSWPSVPPLPSEAFGSALSVTQTTSSGTHTPSLSASACSCITSFSSKSFFFIKILIHHKYSLIASHILHGWHRLHLMYHHHFAFNASQVNSVWGISFCLRHNARMFVAYQLKRSPKKKC